MGKTLYIMAGVPGCGKSKWVNDSCHGSATILSTDRKFMVEGVYQFDISKLAEYHSDTFHEFLRSVARGDSSIYIDNTNLAPWERQNYTRAAKMHGYDVVLNYFRVETIDQIVTCAARNVHGVPIDKIFQMVMRQDFSDESSYDLVQRLLFDYSVRRVVSVPRNRHSLLLDLIETIPGAEYDEFARGEDTVSLSVMYQCTKVVNDQVGDYLSQAEATLLA